MQTLHIAPGDSAGGSMLQAIRNAGRSEEVLRFRDDLSCGPIDSDDPSARVLWWSRFYDDDSWLVRFWNRVTTTDERLVVWFGRHSALELAFFLAWTDLLGDRPYDVIDVTGMQWPRIGPDGSAAILTRPATQVSIIQPGNLQTLLGSERPLSCEERTKARRQWQRLRQENAPFRIVTPTGLASAPVNHFDAILIGCASREWQRLIRIIGDALGRSSETYHQVGDLMLLERMVTLIGEGKFLAEGDPWDMQSCRVRLPD